MIDTQTLALFGVGISAANFLLTWGVAFYVHLMNKDKATTDSIKAMREDFDSKLDSHSDRIARLETLADKAPTHKDMAEIHEKINQVSRCVNRLEGEFSGATRTLQLIHETLMEQSRRQ